MFEDLPAGPIHEGDTGLVLNDDGSFHVFGDADAEQNKKLRCLAAALSTPMLMDLLYDVATDPEAGPVFGKCLLN